MRMPFRAVARAGAVLLLVVAATGVAACGSSDRTPPASSTADTADRTANFLGRWNYDLPDRETGTNISASDLPGRERVPQVGDLVITADGANHVLGRTNVGCTWRFRVGDDELTLDPADQYCYNPTSDIGYTIHDWSLALDGDHLAETFHATSHHDRDYTFEITDGARTRADEYDPESVKPFLGPWTYDTPDRGSGVNIRTTARIGPDRERVVEPAPEQGTVTITGDYGHRITARMSDGCAWTLVTRGNTAMLDPAVQTCTTSENSVTTLRSLVISTDGESLAAVMSGVDADRGSFNISSGSLHKGESRTGG
jgi:hypothetical protein